MPQMSYLEGGNPLSGAIGSGQLASGTIIDFARALIDGSFLSAEILSGPGMAVALTTSGALQLAMAGNPNRMPAVGVITSNYLSGVNVIAYRNGVTYGPTWNFSGWPNETTFVGESGTLIASGTPLSGSVQQIVGTTINASGIFLTMGDPLTQVTVLSGDLGSGQVGTTHFASGTAAYALGDLIQTAETISGGRAVCFNGSGFLIQAMASVSGRMPAVGILASNYLSGIQAFAQRDGMVLSTLLSTDNLSGGISGLLNQLIYVGRSGNLTGYFSGRLATPEQSGDWAQCVGVGVSWSGLYLQRG